MKENLRLEYSAITFSALIFVLVIPFLEVSPTHVLNPDWPGHARLHEVWQLTSNIALSLLACWLVLTERSVKLGLGIGLILSGAFVVAWLSSSFYGGSMLHSDGTEVAIGNINLGVLIMLINLLLLSAAMFRRQLGSS